MQSSKFSFKNNLILTAFLTWFGCGLSKIAPGTVGSVGTLPVVFILKDVPVAWKLVVATLTTLAAIIGCAYHQTISSEKDPKYVVIDEVAGMLWSTLLCTSSVQIALAFAWFRFFDITKIFPANLFDKLSKSSKSPNVRGASIVLDDIIAGAFAFGTVHFATYLLES